MDNPIKSERMWQAKQQRVRQRKHQPIRVLQASDQSVGQANSLELTENERQQTCRSALLMQRLAGQVDSAAEVSNDHRARSTRAASDKNALSGRRPEAIMMGRKQKAEGSSGQDATIVSLKRRIRLHQRLLSLQSVNMVHLLLLMLLFAGGELGLGHKRNLVSSRSHNKPAGAFQMEADERQMQLMRSANVELTRRSQRFQRDAISATSMLEGPASAAAAVPASAPSSGAATCGYPGSPAHASVTFNTSQVTVGTAASYTCDNGYELLGPPRRLCQANGTWSPVGIPFCGKYQTISSAWLVSSHCFLHRPIIWFGLSSATLSEPFASGSPRLNGSSVFALTRPAEGLRWSGGVPKRDCFLIPVWAPKRASLLGRTTRNDKRQLAG